MDFIAGVRNTGGIKKLISGKGPIKCAVAFWGESAFELLENSKEEIKIICNLESGATNPSVIRRLKTKSNISIKSYSRLHAKVYLSPNDVVIGSANCSSNGLSYEGAELSGWLEAGVYSAERKLISEVNRWFDQLWDSLENLSEKEIEEAQIEWEKRRALRKPIVKEKDVSIIEAFRQTPESFKDKKIFFAIYVENASSTDVKAFEREAKKGISEISGRLDFFVDWPELPTNSYLINFKFDPFKKRQPSGFMISKTMEKHVFRKGAEGSKLLFCEIEKDIEGFKLPKDKSFLKSIAHDLWQRGIGDDDGRVVEIYAAKDILLA